MGLLFENAKLDIQEERRKVEVERQKAEKARQEAAEKLALAFGDSAAEE